MNELYSKPSYPKTEDALFQTLRKDVNDTVKQLESKRQTAILYKAFMFPVFYIVCYSAILIFGSNITVLYLLYALMGFLLVINFLNLIHEAVHNTLFESKQLNKLYINFFDILGANSFIWRIRHIRLHHAFPNIMGWDSDFEQSDVARVFPHGNYSKMHKYQYLYLPFIYPLYLFNWLLVRDFKDFFNKKQLLWKVATIPRVEYVKLFFFKAFFLFYIIVLPKIVLSINWGEIIIAFLIMMFTASIISLIVLLSPHATVESEFPLPDEKGKMPFSWLLHQLATTNDVKEDNWFTRFFMGCFNYHIAHHLFPSIHHVYYPEITEVIEQFAKDHNLPYRKVALRTSLYNHYRLLKSNSVHEDIFEDTM